MRVLFVAGCSLALKINAMPETVVSLATLTRNESELHRSSYRPCCVAIA